MQSLYLLPLILLLRKLKTHRVGYSMSNNMAKIQSKSSRKHSGLPDTESLYQVGLVTYCSSRKTLRGEEHLKDPGLPHLFDPFLVLGGAARRVDAEALLEHGHAGLGFTTLDLRQPVLLQLLPSFQNLNHSLIVALHLFLLLSWHIMYMDKVTLLTPDPKVFNQRQREVERKRQP